MTALSTYGTLTGRRITPHTIDWIADMVARWGEEQVEQAIAIEARAGDLRKLLERVSNRCAQAAIARLPARVGPMPVELHRDELLAIARGKRRGPDQAFHWSSAELTGEEYAEVLASPLVRGSLRDVAVAVAPDSEPTADGLWEGGLDLSGSTDAPDRSRISARNMRTAEMAE